MSDYQNYLTVSSICYQTNIIAEDFSKHALEVQISLKVEDNRWQTGSAEWPDNRMCHQKLVATIFRKIKKTDNDHDYENIDEFYKEKNIQEILQSIKGETFEFPIMDLLDLIISIIDQNIAGIIKSVASIVIKFGGAGSSTNCAEMKEDYDNNAIVAINYLRKNFNLQIVADEVYYLSLLQLSSNWRYWNGCDRKALYIYHDKKLSKSKQLYTDYCKKLYQTIIKRLPTETELKNQEDSFKEMDWQEKLVEKLVVEKKNSILSELYVWQSNMEIVTKKALDDFIPLEKEIHDFINDKVFPVLLDMVRKGDGLLNGRLKGIKFNNGTIIYSTQSFFYVWRIVFKENLKAKALIHRLLDLYIECVRKIEKKEKSFDADRSDLNNNCRWINPISNSYASIQSDLKDAKTKLNALDELVQPIRTMANAYFSIDELFKEIENMASGLVTKYPTIPHKQPGEYEFSFNQELLDSKILRKSNII